MSSYSKLDQFLIELQNAVLNPRSAKRPSPAATLLEATLSNTEQNLSASLMRVNHTGEICAQALYLGQAFVAKDSKTRAHLLQAADEEADHLNWCQQRLQELNSHTSVLNIGFFTLSVLTGMIAGLASDKISLGFIAQTEQQVSDHLAGHLDRLPPADDKSRAIVAQMQQDEIKHQNDALDAGAEPLPLIIQMLMKLSAKVMTQTAHYI